MLKKFFLALLILIFLPSCTSSKPVNSPDTLASLCQILRTKIEASNYETQDQSTMKWRNPVDQARLIREYYSYDCPGMLDFAPPP